MKETSYFQNVEQMPAPDRDRYQVVLDRCVNRLRSNMAVIGLRNPKIGLPDKSWSYCGPYDWVVSFHSGQLWLAFQLTGDPAFLNAARARRPLFREILRHRPVQDHDLGFQFSLSCVAEWLMTGEAEARDMAIKAAECLISRYHPDGGYLQAWNASANPQQASFANGRMIADTMQNLALLFWATHETGRQDFAQIADQHAATTTAHLIRDDATSFHTFLFDPRNGKPLRGETHQGYAHDSCWSRGQAWLIHGFAQSAKTTGKAEYLNSARKLARKARDLMAGSNVPVWDFSVPDAATAPRDSSAGAIMAAGLFILANQCEADEKAEWRGFGQKLLDGLIESCDLTNNPAALGLLDHGAAHVTAGYSDNMLPYGDYYFMEALMRSLGHDRFFW